MFVEGYNTGLTRYSEIHGTIDVLLRWHDHPVNEAVSRRHVISANFLAAQLIKEWSCCPLSLTILIKTVRCHWPLRWRASLVWFDSPIIIPAATRKGDRTRLLLLRKLFHLLAEKHGLRTDRGAGGGVLAGDPLDLPVPVPIRCWHRPVGSRRAPKTWPSILIIVMYEAEATYGMYEYVVVDLYLGLLNGDDGLEQWYDLYLSSMFVFDWGWDWGHCHWCQLTGAKAEVARLGPDDRQAPRHEWSLYHSCKHEKVFSLSLATTMRTFFLQIKRIPLKEMNHIRLSIH